MKLLFWISITLSFFNNIAVNAQDIGQVVTTTQEETKTPGAKTKVIVAIKTSLDSFGLDWNTYGIKPHESIDIKFAKSMLDWLTVSKMPTIEELFVLNSENEAKEYSHVIQWNLSIRKINTPNKVQQFQLSADYFIADKKNPDVPFYKGSVPMETRTFPADLIKQIPDVMNKSLVTLSVPHWQKIRQTLLAMQPSQENFYVLIKNYKNIAQVLNLIDYWKEQSKSAMLEIKLESFDQSIAKLKVWHRSNSTTQAMKLITPTLPANNEQLSFKLTNEKSEEPEQLIFSIN
jgi:hypothetical protein